MKFYGKSEQVATRILDLFQSGSVPKALAPIFVHRADSVPCRQWSWANQLLTALAGTSDARGFRQWEHAGRKVSKGSKAFHILGPVTKKIEVRDADTGETSERMAVLGFKSIPVFAIESTEVFDVEKWAEADKASAAERQFIDALPLVSVARSWGLSVDTFIGASADSRADSTSIRKWWLNWAGQSYSR
ncbi:MAG: hypothetical protein KAY37_12005 [Phycisphaerae bacterium]|nr:hypothetical protein [Phycisphaerae bacterium]